MRCWNDTGSPSIVINSWIVDRRETVRNTSKFESFQLTLRLPKNIIILLFSPTACVKLCSFWGHLTVSLTSEQPEPDADLPCDVMTVQKIEIVKIHAGANFLLLEYKTLQKYSKDAKVTFGGDCFSYKTKTTRRGASLLA